MGFLAWILRDGIFEGIKNPPTVVTLEGEQGRLVGGKNLRSA
jgi:hypothetical protein